MRSARHVADSWLRSRLRSATSRVARNIFEPMDEDEDEDEDEGDDDFHFDLFKPMHSEPKREPARAPKKPSAKNPKAPEKPQVAPKPESGPGQVTLRNDPLFQEFLNERYQAGEARVPNPNHENRERFPDVVFSTAMKDSGFRRQVSREFEQWKGERDEKAKREKPDAEEVSHKRLQVGDVLRSLAQLRVGDVLQSSRPGAPKRRVQAIEDGYVRMVEVDDDGEHGPVHSYPANSITSGRHKRVEDPDSPEARKGRADAEKKRRLEREEAEKRERLEQEAKKNEAKKLREKARAKRKHLPEWAKKQDELLDLAQDGVVLSEKSLGGGVNETSIRTMKLGKQQHRFVWKPLEGERADLRLGIEAGTYHQREAAAYNIDRLLGEGTTVPPTISNGEGSYQAFRDGAGTFYDERFNGNIPRLTKQELLNHPDFQRINVLDMILGHEDRHAGNIMLVKDASAPNGVRFIAIDNGLSLADPSEKSAYWDYNFVEPWTIVFAKAGQAVYDATHHISPEMHKRVKDVDHEEFLKAMIESGIQDRPVLEAALVRLSALQRDPDLLDHLNTQKEDSTKSIAKFYYMAGEDPEELLEVAGPGPTYKELRETVTRALQ